MERFKGPFSLSLAGLEQHLKTLFEGHGGADAIALLDILGKLNSREQAIVLQTFTKVIQRISRGEVRLKSEGNAALKAFEDTLYHDVLKALHEPAKGRVGLEVLPGGKENQTTPTTPTSSVVDIEDLRRARRAGGK